MSTEGIHPEDTAEFAQAEFARLKAIDWMPETIAAELTMIRGRLTPVETRICLEHQGAWKEAENISRVISRIDRLTDAITKTRAFRETGGG